MKWETLVRLGHELPEVEEGTSYRTPALKVRGKTFVRLKEDGESAVFFLEDVEQQEILIAARPDVYFITDHYDGYALVLARLKDLRADEARARLRQGWRIKAPKSLVRKHDGTRT